MSKWITWSLEILWTFLAVTVTWTVAAYAINPDPDDEPNPQPVAIFCGDAGVGTYSGDDIVPEIGTYFYRDGDRFTWVDGAGTRQNAVGACRWWDWKEPVTP